LGAETGTYFGEKSGNAWLSIGGGFKSVGETGKKKVPGFLKQEKIGSILKSGGKNIVFIGGTNLPGGSRRHALKRIVPCG